MEPLSKGIRNLVLCLMMICVFVLCTLFSPFYSTTGAIGIFGTVEENRGKSQLDSENHSPWAEVTYEEIVRERFDTERNHAKNELAFHSNNDSISNDTIPNTTNTNETVGIKTILFWTTRYRGDWADTWGKGRDPFKRCEFSACTATSDKSKLDEASMLMFFHMDEPNFPERRNPRQLYVHTTKDPPRDKTKTYLDAYEDVLNLTANYRPTADIYSPYGIYEEMEVLDEGNHDPKVPFHERTKSIAWMVSHCITNSNRHQYVKELRKYIDVDIYGRCGNYTCPKDLGFEYCFANLSKTYKFYLAFENNFCPDYISEKMPNAIRSEMVPIVLGMPNYTHDTRVAPPHSVIDIRDFATPRDLASFLKQMTENEYNEYFQWKAKYRRVGTEAVLCALCRILHSEKYQNGGQFVPSYKKYGGYRKWWQDTCDNDLITRMRKKGGW